ncbi:hypothetical protein [Nonomuraea sp. bgisy101]|uniref:hypothetical protein n=1 Tax=Nonomuraea sp. bgisy101 TaxID=3413784 RepID=UPI003D73DEA6
MIHSTGREPLSEPLAALQDEHPGWSIWVSDGSKAFPPHCYATRLGHLTADQAKRGLAMTLDADTPEHLATQLADQTTRESA